MYFFYRLMDYNTDNILYDSNIQTNIVIFQYVRQPDRVRQVVRLGMLIRGKV